MAGHLGSLAAGVALAVLVYLAYVLFYVPLSFRRRMAAFGIRAPRFVPLGGILPARNRADKADKPFEAFERLVEECGKNCCMEIAWMPRLLTTDPEVAQDVLVRRAPAFVKPELTRTFLGNMLGQGLVLSDGELHKRQRAIIKPAFHFTNLRAMVELMDVDELLEATWGAAIDASADGSTEVEMPESMSECTLHIIAKAAFGTDFMQDKEASDAIRSVFNEAVPVHTWRMFRLIGFIPLVKDLPTPGKRLIDRSVGRLTAEAERLVEDRREGRTRNLIRNESGKDLLDLLLEARDEHGRGMSAQQLIDEMKTFVLAGHETTSRLLSWTIYELCLHPEMWARLVAEVDAKLGRDGAPTHEALQDMPFVEAVVLEGLRLHPPVSVVVRTACRDVEIRRSDGGPIQIRKGDHVSVSMRQIHLSPDLWKDPESFQPERFLPENRERRHPLSFVPFAAGPRSCIGNKFAELEARAVLCRIAQKYTFELVPGQKIVPRPAVTVGFKYGLRTTIRRRRA
jgi:cytochrome P450